MKWTFPFLLLIAGVTNLYGNDVPDAQRLQITVFVHGTLPKFTDHLLHVVDVPWGLRPMKMNTHAPMMGRIGRILHRADCEHFPIEHCYTFGWSGHLSFLTRRYEGRVLYQTLRNLDGDITLIGHSHGGNVALEVARAAEAAGDTEFKIKRLVLLAVPSQVATNYLVASPVFEEVFSFYSHGDDTQQLDPQGFYRESKKLRKQGYEVPFFSSRFFPEAPQLIQIRVLKDKCNPGHLEFMLSGFIKHLPNLIHYAHNLEHNGAIHWLNICKCGRIYPVERRITRTGKIQYVEVD